MEYERVIAKGVVERIGEPMGSVQMDTASRQIRRKEPVPDHSKALDIMEVLLRESETLESFRDLDGVGHRVVHGGETFRSSVIVDDSVIDAIERVIPLAPLHNPAHLLGIRSMRDKAPDLVQVTVFDTAFHQTIPQHAYLYPLPFAMYEEYKIRRYGFHGTSHYFVANKAAKTLARPIKELDIITLHLGNGASVAAIKGGHCIDTSMGFTPLAGLMMGTRSGDIDPAVVLYLSRKGMDVDSLDKMLNKQSGLKGICDENDMRTVIKRYEEGDKKAELAFEMFCYRIKKFIGAYAAALGGLDALVFTGGIGEHSVAVRKKVCEDLGILGIHMDEERNRRCRGDDFLQTRESRAAIMVVATNEEFEIARQSAQLLMKKER